MQSCSNEESSIVTLKGIHDTIGGIQKDGSQEIEKLANSRVDVFSSDFGFSTHPNDDYRKRAELLKKILDLSHKKKIITLSYHQCRPDIEGACSFDKGVANLFFNENEWKELLSWNSPLNKKWQKQMREMGDFISILKDHKTKIYLRPYHEPNIPLFWWSNINRPENFIALWKMLYKFYVEDMKLDNIVWVWSVSYHPKYLGEISKFYPGDNWVDVLGFDIYSPGKGKEPNFSDAWEILKEIAPNKPLALSEVSRLPSKEELRKHHWLYVVPWGITMLKRDNSNMEIQKFYKD